jgi:hypothetical protein
VFRGVLGAGEAIIFGLDSINIPYIAEAGGILLFYVIGICVFYYLGFYHIKDTNYDLVEVGAVVPNHILEGKNLTPGQRAEKIARVAAEAKGQKVNVDEEKV